MRYPALIDGEKGAYGIVFPDLPGCLAMGATIDEAIQDAQEALPQWIEAADTINSESKRRGISRKAYVEEVVRIAAQMGR